MADNQNGFQANARRTHGGHLADKVWRRGQSGIKADAGHSGQPFFLSKTDFRSKQAVWGKILKFSLGRGRGRRRGHCRDQSAQRQECGRATTQGTESFLRGLERGI